MVNKDAFQKYLDAGLAFTTITKARAEELVSELVQSGEFQSSDAGAKVEELIERSRKGREVVVAQVRHEVTRQLEAVGITNLEDLAEQVAALIGRSAATGKAATGATKETATAKSAGTKATAKKTTAKKTTATKSSAATKAAAKKSPARTAAAKKTAAKKTTATKKTTAAATKSAAGGGSAG